jgi:GNAT superfamily N-acetyltransferase
MDIPTRVAAAQLAGLRRVRHVVEAPPFVALLATSGPDLLSYAVAAHPGQPVREVGSALPVLRAAFGKTRLRFELVAEASPGAVETLLAEGLVLIRQYPLLTARASEVELPKSVDHVTVSVVGTREEATQAREIAAVAFGQAIESDEGPPVPTEGGTVLARVGGEPVAVASWTPVADGVTEIVGVATLPGFRRRGIGALVTAHTVRAAATLAGVTLPWLTPGDSGADRVYRRIGFSPVATAVHLADPETSRR